MTRQDVYTYFDGINSCLSGTPIGLRAIGQWAAAQSGRLATWVINSLNEVPQGPLELPVEVNNDTIVQAYLPSANFLKSTVMEEQHATRPDLHGTTAVGMHDATGYAHSFRFLNTNIKEMIKAKQIALSFIEALTQYVSTLPDGQPVVAVDFKLWCEAHDFSYGEFSSEGLISAVEGLTATEILGDLQGQLNLLAKSQRVNIGLKKPGSSVTEFMTGYKWTNYNFTPYSTLVIHGAFRIATGVEYHADIWGWVKTAISGLDTVVRWVGQKVLGTVDFIKNDLNDVFDQISGSQYNGIDVPLIHILFNSDQLVSKSGQINQVLQALKLKYLNSNVDDGAVWPIILTDSQSGTRNRFAIHPLLPGNEISLEYIRRLFDENAIPEGILIFPLDTHILTVAREGKQYSFDLWATNDRGELGRSSNSTGLGPKFSLGKISSQQAARSIPVRAFGSESSDLDYITGMLEIMTIPYTNPDSANSPARSVDFVRSQFRDALGAFPHRYRVGIATSTGIATKDGTVNLFGPNPNAPQLLEPHAAPYIGDVFSLYGAEAAEAMNWEPIVALKDGTMSYMEFFRTCYRAMRDHYADSKYRWSSLSLSEELEVMRWVFPTLPYFPKAGDFERYLLYPESKIIPWTKDVSRWVSSNVFAVAWMTDPVSFLVGSAPGDFPSFDDYQTSWCGESDVPPTFPSEEMQIVSKNAGVEIFSGPATLVNYFRPFWIDCATISDPNDFRFDVAFNMLLCCLAMAMISLRSNRGFAAGDQRSDEFDCRPRFLLYKYDAFSDTAPPTSGNVLIPDESWLAGWYADNVFIPYETSRSAPTFSVHVETADERMKELAKQYLATAVAIGAVTAIALGLVVKSSVRRAVARLDQDVYEARRLGYEGLDSIVKAEKKKKILTNLFGWALPSAVVVGSGFGGIKSTIESLLTTGDISMDEEGVPDTSPENQIYRSITGRDIRRS